MTFSILKFGGTSLANTKLMADAVAKVVTEVALGYKVVVVVSAMAGVTDHLSNLVQEMNCVNLADYEAEYANVITTGEQISSGLFALSLQQAGIKARSWLGWQLDLITNDNLIDADIIEFYPEKIISSFEQGYQVAVVAGFQAISRDDRVSALGRGGSDSSAIILASFLKAEKCDIYTDVEGVFTADPRIVPKAKKINYINYDEMIAFAHAGAKVLQAKSVELAKKYKISVRVLSSFTVGSGTILGNFENNKNVIGIAVNIDNLSQVRNLDVARVSIIGTNISMNEDLVIDLQKILYSNAIEILEISKSSMIVSFILKDEYKFAAIRLLHNACGLDEAV